MLRNKILIYILLVSSLFGAKYLAVIDLEATGVSHTEAKVLTQTLTTRMIELSDYIVVERANIDKILKEQKFQHSGCTDRECAVEIGQLLNADITVIGTAGKVGSTYTLQTRIINVESGEALKSADYTHKGEIDELLSEGVEYVAHKLLGIPYQKKIKSKSSSGYGATLEVNSEPLGAKIYIGGNYFDTTPLILEDFPAGEYEVSIKLTNYQDYIESVTLQPRGSNKISADLLCMNSVDCAGICNGDALEDNCGTCDTDTANDCTQDCSGTWGGTAVLDTCDICGGDGTQCQDCAGTTNGTATTDNCGTCDTDTSNDCVQDCAGTWGGYAVLDECGICEGPGAIYECGCKKNMDCAGECGGDDSSCEDCAGVQNGGAVEDECGTCDSDSSNDCVQDCNNEWGGNAKIDNCGICGGDSSTCIPYTKADIIITTIGLFLVSFIYAK